MAAMGETLKAKTRNELRSLAAARSKQARRFTIQLGYDPDRVKQTEDGYEIYMRAHS
jgi:hypothetical protein